MNFFKKSPVVSKIQDATSELNLGPDRSQNMEICQMVKNNPESAKDAIKCIRKKMKEKNPKVAVLSLHVLDALMRECGHPIYEQVASKEMIADMDKLARNKTTDSHLCDKLLSLVQLWGTVFHPSQYPAYGELYDALVSSGIRFPEPTQEAFRPVSKKRRRQQGGPGMSEAQIMAAVSVDFDLEILLNNVNLLSEIISFADPKADPLDNDLMQELVMKCNDAGPSLQGRIKNTRDDTVLMQLLALNDELQRVLDAYEKLVSGEAAVAALEAEEAGIYHAQDPGAPAGVAVLPVPAAAVPAGPVSLGAAPTQDDGFHQAPVSLDNVSLLDIFGGGAATATAATSPATSTPQQPREAPPLVASTALSTSPPRLAPPPTASRSRTASGPADAPARPTAPATGAEQGVDLLGLGTSSVPPPTSSPPAEDPTAPATPDDFDAFLNSRTQSVA